MMGNKLSGMKGGALGRRRLLVNTIHRAVENCSLIAALCVLSLLSDSVWLPL